MSDGPSSGKSTLNVRDGSATTWKLPVRVNVTNARHIRAARIPETAFSEHDWMRKTRRRTETVVGHSFELIIGSACR